MSITLTALQKQRTDTAANWTTANPTLLSGELGFESDTGKMKLGNGSTAWNSLAYLILIPSSGVYPGTQLLMPLGSASAPSLTFNGDPNTGIYSPGADQVALSTGGTGRLFISSSGLVGIGGTTSSWSLHVQSAGQRTTVATESISGGTSGLGRFLAISDSGNAEFGMSGSGYTGITGASDACIINANAASNGICFAIDSVLRAKIDSSGRLGLGTSSPGSTLHVVGQTQSVYNASYSDTANYGFAFKNSTTTAKQLWGGYDGTADAGFIQSTHTGVAHKPLLINPNGGNVGIGTTGPASKLEVEGGATAALFSVKASSGDVVAITARAAGGGGILGALNNALSDFEPLEINAEYIAFQRRNGVGTVQECGRFDTSGRLLIGTSSSPNAGQGQYSRIVVQGYIGNDTSAGYFSLARGEGAANITSGETLGVINFTDNVGNTFAQITADADAAAGSGDYPGRLVFSTTADGASSPTERLRINSSGVTQSDSTSWNFVCLRSSGTGQGHIQFKNGGVEVGYISSTSTATTYATSSDYRLKENIVPLTGAADRLNRLQVHRFNFIIDPSKTVDGFLAHEAQAVVPECVTGTKDEVDADGNPIYQGIDQSKLVPLLTAALQEALAEIESLKARLIAAGI